MPRTQIFPDRSDNHGLSITDQQSRQLYSTRAVSGLRHSRHRNGASRVHPKPIRTEQIWLFGKDAFPAH